MQRTAVFMMMMFVCMSRVLGQSDLSFETDLSDAVAEERSEALGSLVSLDEVSSTAPDAVRSGARDASDIGALDEDDADAMGSDIAVEGHLSDTEDLDVDAAPSRTLSGWMVLGASAAATVVAIAAL